MRNPVLVLATMVVASCASSSDSSGQGDYKVSAGFGAPPPSEERTFSCPRSLSDCRRQAEEYCGEAGYRRVRTQRDISADMAESGLPRVGRSGTVSESEIRSRASIGDDADRAMTVRCRDASD